MTQNLQWKETNLLSLKYGIIAHQVNCQGIVDTPLFQTIKERYFVAWLRYRQACLGHIESLDSETLLGECLTCRLDATGKFYIAHLFGQFFANQPGEQSTEYRALKLALRKLNQFAQSQQLPIYLPNHLGCDEAGGDWETVSRLILKYCPTARICQIDT